MLNVYPRLRPGVKLRVSRAGTDIVDAVGHNYGLREGATCIYRKCDGTKTIGAIGDELAEEWDYNNGQLTDFFIDAAKRGLIAFSPTPQSTPITPVGSPDSYFPACVSIEITTTCNIACTYCYGCYGPDKKEKLPVERIQPFFEMLASRGVCGLEITGGEPLAHPKFAELYRLAFEYFHGVALISNGILWKAEHFDILKRYREKAYVQISVDGSNETVSAIVRQKERTFDKTVNTLKRLVELDVLLRVAMVVTKENVHDLRDTAQLVRDLGVKMFAVSLPDGIGRGSELTYGDGKSLNNLTSPGSTELVDAITAVNVEFKDIIYNMARVQEEYGKIYPGEDARKEFHNCGAGHSMVAIRANGDITGCQYMQDRVAHLGNIFEEEDPSRPFNSEKSLLMRAFYKDASDPSCMHCTYNGFCANCMVRIYEANRERLVSGKGLCGVVRRNKLDRVFDFTLPSMHNVSGLVASPAHAAGSSQLIQITRSKGA